MDKQTYEQYRQQLIADQNSLTKDELLQKMNAENEVSIDLDNLPKQKHNFVKRGIVISCEGAGHPSHRHFLVKR